MKSFSSELAVYDFDLPHELIAQSPLRHRADARLMVVNRAEQSIQHFHVRDIHQFLRPEDCLVLNNTKVIPARLIGRRASTGGSWEGLFLSFDEHGFWKIMCKTRGKLQPGEKIDLQTPEGRVGFPLEMVTKLDQGNWVVRPLEKGDAFELLQRVGWVPIPPYIRNGRMIPSDKEYYQTVYASQPGAVAAPTAGLHFTPQLLQRIQEMGVDLVPVILHVGAGTFRPISVEKLEDHQMHEEWIDISEKAVARILRRHESGGRVIAVGTTSVRVLESASLESGQLQPFTGQTRLFIKPGYKFRVTDAMMTNFHLPLSTLLILVRTFGGDELLKRAYHEAIQEKYRFFSYGDAMLIF